MPATSTTPDASTFTTIIDAVGKNGYFGVAALILLIFFFRGWKNVPKEFTGIVVLILSFGFITKYMEKHTPPPAPCPKPVVTVSLVPATLKQLATTLQMGEELPEPKLNLSTKQACAKPNRPPELKCPEFNFDFPIEANHEYIQVSYTAAVEVLQERIANVQAIAAAASAKGVSGQNPGVAP